MLLLMKPLVLDSELLCRAKGWDGDRSRSDALAPPAGMLRLLAPWQPWNWRYGFALRTSNTSLKDGLFAAHSAWHDEGISEQRLRALVKTAHCGQVAVVCDPPD